MKVGPPIRLAHSDSAEPLSWVARIVSAKAEEVGALWDGREGRYLILSRREFDEVVMAIRVAREYVGHPNNGRPASSAHLDLERKLAELADQLDGLVVSLGSDA